MGDRPTTLAQRLASHVRTARRGRRWTQEQLAARADMAIELLQKVEAGRSNATLGTLERLATALEVEAWTLLTPTDPPERRRRGRPSILPQ